MAPRKTTPKKTKSGPSDPQGMFSGMVVYLVESGVQPRRLEIWKRRLEQMGATVENSFSKKVTHVFAMDLNALRESIDLARLECSNTKVLVYQWLEDSLREGKTVSEESYILPLESGKGDQVINVVEKTFPETSNEATSGVNEDQQRKKVKLPTQETESASLRTVNNLGKDNGSNSPNSLAGSDSSTNSQSPSLVDRKNPEIVGAEDSTSLYRPPDLNRGITEIFGKLLNIYRALGDDRRSFSYYKAIPVIEKLPFKIESAEQVKNLPAIGKSIKDHIQEIVATGKLSKLEHFEMDEKVRTISLFGEVWGVGPATAVKLYEKGHRTLEDLKSEESLTHAQRVGLEYFDDINTRIPREEVQEMECLLKKVGEEILPEIDIVCGGSYRRGKSSCGDMDIIITHHDGLSHIGFLSKYVKRLKEIKFLREDLIFSIHSEEGTDSGVDTYFGLCTSPGRELRRRIDLKVYPRNIYAFALIHWTGNDVLNRRLRLLADSKGFLLDDTGLYPATRSSGPSGGKRTRGSASLKFGTEKEVFDFLGFPWLEPHERNL